MTDLTSIRRFVIGDIHGCIKTLNSLLFNTLKITKSDLLFLVGDYIDRGSNSKEVIDLLIKMDNEGFQIFPCIGNHDEMMLAAIDSSYWLNNWFLNGGKSTLKSFGVQHPGDIGKNYLDFFRKLKYYFMLNDFIIVHAGLNFQADAPFEDYYSMVWTRYENYDKTITGGRRIVSGHTPKTLQAIKNSLATTNIFIDGGCVYANRFSSLGYLCALELGSLTLFTVYNEEL